MGDTGDRPEIIECEIRLHTGPPTGRQGQWSDWQQTAVGEPVTFRAIAITSEGAWNGPLPPGAVVAAPVAMGDPYWSVFLPAPRGLPVLFGPVGRVLGIGESFTLLPREASEWTKGVVFEGAIVIE